MGKIVEIGMLLDLDLDYYDEMLKNQSLDMVFSCETHDIYYTKLKYDELCSMTENQIKNSCVRIRDCINLYSNKKFEEVSDNSKENKSKKHKIDNKKQMAKKVDIDNISLLLSDENKSVFENKKDSKFLKSILEKYDSQKDRLKTQKQNSEQLIEILENNGFYLIFDTFKVDYHYTTSEMKSRIQLQEIDNIGLVLYYDNPDYYQMPEDLQRKSLIDEMNSLGFNFKYEELGIDKLRTLLLGYTVGSFNQNG